MFGLCYAVLRYIKTRRKLMANAIIVVDMQKGFMAPWSILKDSQIPKKFSEIPKRFSEITKRSLRSQGFF